MLEIGSVVDGKYKILNKIGQGGMSIVYLAMNERANKQWAIKEVRKDGIQNFEVVKQGLIVETDMLKKLTHPHLPSIVDVIDEDGRFLIVMDYIEGNPLSQALKDYGAQPQDLVIEWAKQLCDVLGYLHTRNSPIIYRDMKPSNVMLKPDGNLTLIDFGTAREYKSNSVADTTCLGTQGYAAPEQFGGQGQTDARTDIYCLGATLYHLVTGHNPSEPPYEMYPIRHWNPALSSGLEEIILKCTQRNPNDRYQSCAELMYALEHYGELDAEYRKSQNKKLGLFIATTVFAVGFGVASVITNGIKTDYTKENYDTFIAEAKIVADGEEKMEMLRNAINLDPSRGDSYEIILDHFIQDDILTVVESEQLREIMAEVNGSAKNETHFKSDAEKYGEFAFDAGIYYFYCYEKGDDKAQAIKWLGIAAASKDIPAIQAEKASTLYKIATYYSSIGKESAFGEDSVSYKEVWDDLVSLAAGNLAENTNARTALEVYKYFTCQINDSAQKFLKNEISKEDMRAQLANIESRLETDFEISEEQSINARLVSEIKKNIENAYGSVEAAKVKQ